MQSNVKIGSKCVVWPWRDACIRKQFNISRASRELEGEGGGGIEETKWPEDSGYMRLRTKGEGGGERGGQRRKQGKD